MSQKHRHINHNITNEVSYAILSKPTTATFISKEIMETAEEKDRVRQASKVVQAERKLVKNKETKR
jgi:hypothetical protein|tara:strand:- start:320 stop:517 length:198 start_codon:yes stop_codon:yes gene_type:complete